MKYSPDSLEGRFLSGDPEAIGTVSRWISTVLTDLRYWGLQGEWLDLHQDSIVGVLVSLRRGRFDPTRDFRAYVLATARFTIRQSVRRRRRRREIDAPSAGTETAAGEASPESAMLRALTVRKALTGLSQGCQDLIAAYFFEQRDAAEIATRLDIPIGTVKSRLFRCLENARQGLLSHVEGTGFDARRELQGRRGKRISMSAPRFEREPNP